ncbi:hypothetical protein [Belliella pelovolcani]|uniref:hypothetical protein n=1 Tax=Belliella pelovolcani TaxID=529505 RepID=UPI00391AA146
MKNLLILMVLCFAVVLSAPLPPPVDLSPDTEASISDHPSDYVFVDKAFVEGVGLISFAHIPNSTDFYHTDTQLTESEICGNTQLAALPTFARLDKHYDPGRCENL